MAESPEDWDLLESSLAVWNLQKDANKAWAFLVIQGLVQDRPGDRDIFQEIVQKEVSRQITGPTVSRRVGFGLRRADLAASLEDQPDPWAEIARARLDTILGWKQAP